MKAQRLNKAGRLDFKRMVEAFREGTSSNSPEGIINDEYAVEPLDFDLEVSLKGFNSRFEMGQYLADALAPVEKAVFVGDQGFWDWLALYWFDDLCPLNSSGERRRPSAVPNYIMSEDYKRRYRHAVYITWQLVDQYGERAKFLLYKEPWVRGELTEQFLARQFYLSCNGVIDAARELYWDDQAATLKTGAGGKSRGSARRFVAWLQQLEVTYDLYSMTSTQLLELIPNEFDRFRIS